MARATSIAALAAVIAGFATQAAASETQAQQCARSPQGWWREVCVVDSRLLVSPERAWGQLEIHPELTAAGWQWILINRGATYTGGDGCVTYSPGDVRCLDQAGDRDIDVIDVQPQRENGSVEIGGITSSLVSLIRVHGGPLDDRVAVEAGDYQVNIEGDDGGDILRGAGEVPGRGLVIDGGAGDDRLTGSPGPDTVTGGTGSDEIMAGSGDDVVHAEDHGTDLIDCGPGSDVVYADAGDVVANCESGRRRPDRARLLFADSAGVHLVDADGSRIETIFPAGCFPSIGTAPPPYCPAFPQWSPDGTRVAFAFRDRLYVWESLSGKTAHVPTGVPVRQPFLAWAPDGARLAFIGTSGSGLELYVEELASGSTTKITSNGWVEGSFDWSPDGEWIAYTGKARERTYLELFVVASDGSSRRQLTDGGEIGRHVADPVWSPAGDEVAFSAQEGARAHELHVIGPDGSGLRKLANSPLFARHLGWTPDGQRLLVTARNIEEPWLDLGASIWMVNADGSGANRLTEGRFDYDYSPTLAPESRRLAFVRGEGLAHSYESRSRWGVYVANVDGTCERRVAAVTPLPGVSWQPGGPGPERVGCRDLVLSAKTGRLIPVGEARLHVSVVNRGNEPITRVSLHAVTSNATLSSAGPTQRCQSEPNGISCASGALEPGERDDMQLLLRPRVLTVRADGRAYEEFAVSIDVRGAETESELANNSLVRHLTIVDCWPEDPGEGGVEGTTRRDTICGRRGADRIRARAGDDRIRAGRGSDRIDGGRGRDFLRGDAGNDLVLARDGFVDRVSCGKGRDSVVADRRDRVSRDCERVSRR